MNLYGEQFKFGGDYAPQTLWRELAGTYPITKLENPGDEVVLAPSGLAAWAGSRQIEIAKRLFDLNRNVGMVRGLVGFAGNHVALVEHYDVSILTGREQHRDVPGVAAVHLGSDHVNTYRTLGAATLQEPEYRIGRASQRRPLIDSPNIGGGIYSGSVSREQAIIQYKAVGDEPTLTVRHLSTKRSEHATDHADDVAAPFSSHNVTFVMGEVAAAQVVEERRAIPLPRAEQLHEVTPTLQPEPLTATTQKLDVAALRAQFGGMKYQKGV